jgi:isopentenyl diphosphate isomerase/L-lactate dehydrogenase-like FMN-dependent dehydrogenase
VDCHAPPMSITNAFPVFFAGAKGKKTAAAKGDDASAHAAPLAGALNACSTLHSPPASATPPVVCSWLGHPLSPNVW